MTDIDNLADPQWYKDAVIYQIHIKSFFDGNNDGVGDFPGLVQKLDYIAALGVTAIWLLPFYPSPRRAIWRMSADSFMRRMSGGLG
jgi:glycosidase